MGVLRLATRGFLRSPVVAIEGGKATSVGTLGAK